MKFAGIARTLVLAMFGVLFLTPQAPAATDGVTPLRGTVENGSDAVISGTDVFSIVDRKSKPEPKNGYTYTSLLMRTSLLDGSKTLIKKFDPTDTATGFPEDVFASGGYVYVNMTDDGPDRDVLGSSSTVLRMARDGSGLQKVAYGQLNSGEEDHVVVEHGKGRANDCGTEVAAELVTSDGSVVIREMTSDRNSKACGGKKNYDHVRFYLLTPAGITREISIDHIRVKISIHVNPGGGWWSTGGDGEGPDDVNYANVVSVVGDRALIAHPGSPSFWVRDLNTGAETGPYKTGISGRYMFNVGSLDPFGRVAMSSYVVAGSNKHRKSRYAAGVFQSPGDLASFTRLKGQAFLVFCGNHLISMTNHGARELDPVTLNLIRPISPIHKDGSSVWLDNSCSNDYLYMSNQRGKKDTFLAYPLG